MDQFMNIEPEGVLRAFRALCAIPHGSCNTKAISDYCYTFAKERGYECRQDEVNNVVIVKPAAPGYEAAPTVMLQGHMDMVCEKTPDSDFDFTRDGIRLAVDGDWLHAVDTTLGADNGIAVAMALAILDDKTLSHPRLEIILTVDEEIGLDGAVALDMSDLQGRKLINIDSEEEGFITVSCAGGARVQCTLPVERETASGTLIDVTITGLLGGHSGVDIDKGRASSNYMMGRLLNSLSLAANFRLVELSGGTNDNVIASTTTARILTDDVQVVCSKVAEIASVYQKEYLTSDPGMTVSAEVVSSETAQVLTSADTRRVIDMVLLAPQGIQAMSMDIPGLVQTSLNMGMLNLSDAEATLVYAARSSLATQKEMMIERLQALMTLLGGSARAYSAYPAWEYKKESDLRALMLDVYEDLFGKPAQIAATHGGLECGLFCGKLPDLDCVSIGPDILGAHTTQEKVSLSSIKRTWDYLCEVLKRSK